MDTPEESSSGKTKSHDRTRSLSGGTSKMASLREALTHNRMRRPSGDDVLSAITPARKAAIFESTRPRSKSDSKRQRPTIISTIKNSVQQTFSSSSSSTGAVVQQNHQQRLHPIYHLHMVQVARKSVRPFRTRGFSSTKIWIRQQRWTRVQSN
ncbi:uncharacterized protein LOC143246002 [Tachypleus tridentatus]|uniref:uncharacterized protein LOC143246002 n=1 Tax=Tachypleus tridentatus TaxID=6853 RepID=UPI003FD5BB6E